MSSNPTADWTAQQVVEAFLWDTAPKYLMWDRDAIYGVFFRNREKNMGIKEVVSALQSPWQNPFVEPVIGTIRRECTDHVIVLNQAHPKTFFACISNIIITTERAFEPWKRYAQQPADTIQTCRQVQDNRFAAHRWITSSIRVEKSGLKTQIVLIPKASDGLCWSVLRIYLNQRFHIESVFSHKLDRGHFIQSLHRGDYFFYKFTTD